ncbi:hypothetical protein H9P43_006338 [Blastocladiella emersonii ATCC 22665]|nr:hypothetical protein H9P43_006338 [Blastocladiella emersonii ATCC 22665]
MPFIPPTALGATAAAWRDLAASDYFCLQERDDADAAAWSLRRLSFGSLSGLSGNGSAPTTAAAAAASDGKLVPHRHPALDHASPASALRDALRAATHRIVFKGRSQGPRMVVALADARPAILADWLYVEVNVFPLALAQDPRSRNAVPPLPGTERERVRDSPSPGPSGEECRMFDDAMLATLEQITRQPASNGHASPDPSESPNGRADAWETRVQDLLADFEFHRSHLVAHFPCLAAVGDDPAFPARLLLTLHHVAIVPDGDAGPDAVAARLVLPYYLVSGITREPAAVTLLHTANPRGASVLDMVDPPTSPPPQPIRLTSSTEPPLGTIAQCLEVLCHHAQLNLAQSTESRANDRDVRRRVGGDLGSNLITASTLDLLSPKLGPAALATPMSSAFAVPAPTAPSAALTVPPYTSSQQILAEQRAAAVLRTFGVVLGPGEPQHEFAVRIWSIPGKSPADASPSPPPPPPRSPSDPTAAVSVWLGPELDTLYRPDAAPTVRTATLLVTRRFLLFAESGPTQSAPLRLVLPIMELATVAKLPSTASQRGFRAALWATADDAPVALRSRDGSAWAVEAVEAAQSAVIYDTVLARLRRMSLPPVPAAAPRASHQAKRKRVASRGQKSSRHDAGLRSLPTSLSGLHDSATSTAADLQPTFSLDVIPASPTSPTTATDPGEPLDRPLDAYFSSLDPAASPSEQSLRRFWDPYVASALARAPWIEVGPQLIALVCGGSDDPDVVGGARATAAAAGGTLRGSPDSVGLVLDTLSFDDLAVTPGTSGEAIASPALGARAAAGGGAETVIGIPATLRPTVWSLLARGPAEFGTSSGGAPDLDGSSLAYPDCGLVTPHSAGLVSPYSHTWVQSEPLLSPAPRALRHAVSADHNTASLLPRPAAAAALPDIQLALAHQYRDYVVQGEHAAWHEEIEKDVGRSLPEHPAFALGPRGLGQSALRRVLHAFARRNPRVGYAQALNLLAAHLLRVCPEPTAFALLCWLVEQVLPHHFTRTLLGAIVDQQVFEAMVKEEIPEVAAHFARLDVGLAAISVAWFLAVFQSVLPSTAAALVVLDGVFVDRERFVFLLAIGIVWYLAPRLVQAEDELQVLMLFREFFALFEDDEGKNGAPEEKEEEASTPAPRRGLALLQHIIVNAYTRFGPRISHDRIHAMRRQYQFPVIQRLEGDFRKGQLRTLTSMAGFSDATARNVYRHFQWTMLTQSQPAGLLDASGITVFLAKSLGWRSAPPAHLNPGGAAATLGELVIAHQGSAATTIDLATAAATVRDLTAPAAARLRALFALHDRERTGHLAPVDADTLVFHLVWALGGDADDWAALVRRDEAGAGEERELVRGLGELCAQLATGAPEPQIEAAVAGAAGLSIATGKGGSGGGGRASVLGLHGGVSLNEFLLATSSNFVITERLRPRKSRNWSSSAARSVSRRDDDDDKDEYSDGVRQHPTRSSAPLLGTSGAFKHHIRACVLAHGPFSSPQILHDFFYSDYCTLFADDGALLPYSKYAIYVGKVADMMRTHLADIARRLLASPPADVPIPQFADIQSNNDVRTMAFNLSWMLTPASDGPAGAQALHPFLVAMVQRSLRWRDENCLVTVSAYLERLNARVAATSRGTAPTVVTLDHLAPLIVIMVACYASVGIATHISVPWRKLPPLSNLYNELVDALGKQQEPLGKRFVKQCRELIQGIVITHVRRRDTTIGNDVERDALVGIAVAAFVDNGEDDN